jgi:hypothetical protein
VTRLAGIASGARIAVIAGSTIGRRKIDAGTAGRIACPRKVALVEGATDHVRAFTRVAHPICVGVPLIGVGHCGAIVSCIRNAVAVAVLRKRGASGLCDPKSDRKNAVAKQRHKPGAVHIRELALFGDYVEIGVTQLLHAVENTNAVRCARVEFGRPSPPFDGEGFVDEPNALGPAADGSCERRHIANDFAVSSDLVHLHDWVCAGVDTSPAHRVGHDGLEPKEVGSTAAVGCIADECPGARIDRGLGFGFS